VLTQPDRWAEWGRAGRAHVAAGFELGGRTADLEELWLALAAGARRDDLPVPPPVRRTAVRASVVMVTHNRRELVQQTLDSLAVQTRPADEVVVVDNGSTDGTADVLAAAVAAGVPSGLQVLTRPANLSVAEGRNLAVAASSADVVAFTDDDCRPRPTWLESLLAGMRDGIGLVQGRTQADPAQPLRPLSRTQWTPAEFGLYETCNIAYARSALDAAGPDGRDGPFDPAFAADIARRLGPRWEALPFAEDTELGWRAKRAGVRSRFAVHAVVDHEVWPPDPALLRRRAALSIAFPVAIRRVPELRRTFLWGRVFLGRRRAWVWLAIAGAVASLAALSPWPVLALLPYAVDVTDLRRWRRRGVRRRLAAVPTRIAVDTIETWVLLRGSLKARSLVL
jgi:glycosyltransferase involved in cell wall biosynthesis